MTSANNSNSDKEEDQHYTKRNKSNSRERLRINDSSALKNDGENEKIERKHRKEPASSSFEDEETDDEKQSRRHRRRKISDRKQKRDYGSTQRRNGTNAGKDDENNSLKHRKKRDRHRRKRSSTDNYEYSCGSDDSRDEEDIQRRRRSLKHGKISKRRSSKHDRNRSSSDEDRRSRKHKRSKKRRRERRKDRDIDGQTRKDRKNCENDLIPNKKSVLFAESVHSLLQHHPTLSKELPYLLIRLGSGGLNLTNMPDKNLAIALGKVFQSMGCTIDPATKCWVWTGLQDLKHLSSDEKSLFLVKMAIFLLDEVGVTMEAIQEYDNQQRGGQENDKNDETYIRNGEGQAVSMVKDDQLSSLGLRNEITALTITFLNKFDDKRIENDVGDRTLEEKPSTLAKELYDVITIIMEGNDNSISLDGILKNDLRNSLEQLFLAVGLEKDEMEMNQHENDSSYKKSNGQEKEEADTSIVLGYSLPDATTTEELESVTQNLDAVRGVCKSLHEKTNVKYKNKVKRVLGPAMPPTSYDIKCGNSAAANMQITGDDDDDGPMPLGSEAIGSVRNYPTIYSQTLSHTKAEEGGKVLSSHTSTSTSGREEWMMKPGEHDFLKGVMSSGIIKNRKFQNKKTHGKNIDAPITPMDPKIQSQINEIMAMHAEARGSSLIEQHREQKKMEKEEAEKSSNGGMSKWNWNRENDLDKGRRVDKDHLRMVMGGASDQLKDKFQGGSSSRFV